jgi:hypothetical protein
VGHSRRLLPFAVFAALVYGLNVLQYHDYLIDDAFISFRYARNLVEGHGLVYNPGERVEGYTSFSFVLAAAGALWAGIDPLLLTKLVSAAAALSLLLALTRLERRGMVPGPTGRLPLAPLLLLPLQAFAYWSVSAMETMLFAALFLWGVELSFREREAGRLRGAAVVFVLLAMTRPEGVLCFAATGAALAALEWRERRSLVHLRRWASGGALFVVLYGTYFAWRCAYYGELFPNTFHAKVTAGPEQGRQGLDYLLRFVRAFPLFTLLMAAPAALCLGRVRAAVSKRARLGPVLCVWAIAATYVGYVVMIGGDFMPYFRFFVPVFPLIALLGAWLAPGRMVLAALVLHWGASLATTQPQVAFVSHRFTWVGQHVGEWLGRKLEPHAWIAVNTAGSLPYASGLPTIDMLGLTDAAIARRPTYVVSAGWAAHRRGWGDYVLRRRPRIVLWYNMAGSREPHYLSDRELAESPWFRFFYRLRTHTLLDDEPTAPPQRVATFLGHPFGASSKGESLWPEMGLRMRFEDGMVPRTILSQAPITVTYFELDTRDLDLWSLRGTGDGSLEAFLSAVTERWLLASATAPRPDPVALEAVDALCAEAYAEIRAGRHGRANRILLEAVRLNERARSPLVYQYLANLAVLGEDLFVAVHAQKEALRLEPASALHRSNLLALLRQPHARAREAAAEPREEAP